MDNTRYRVWIKAEVFYELASKDEKPDMPLLMDEKAPLTVKIWTEKKRYKKGERITIYMKGNKDYFARIVDKTGTGELIQLPSQQVSSSQPFQRWCALYCSWRWGPFRTRGRGNPTEKIAS